MNMRVKAIVSPLAVALALLVGPAAARADFTVAGSFGPNGDVGFPNSPASLSITFGATGQGTISQLDGFLNVAGQDLNNLPSGFGTSAQLGYGSPAGVAYSFSASQPTANQLLLTYHFVNNTGAALPGFQFLSYIDADIANFTEDYIGVTGTPGAGLPSLTPTSYQAGDPSTTSLFTNVLFGSLDNTNGAPSGSPSDVALSVGFNTGLISAGAVAEFQVLLSDNGTTFTNPGLVLTQRNVSVADALTVSARISIAPVPEPSSYALLALGLGALAATRRRRMAMA